MKAIGVPFELAIVASEIGSYKPADRHWLAFAGEVGRLPDVHVAQSHFHDVVPATQLGVPTIWINRLSEAADPPPTRELPSLVASPTRSTSSSPRSPEHVVRQTLLGKRRVGQARGQRALLRSECA